MLAKQLCTQAKEIHSQATKASGLTRSDIQQTWTTAAGLELRLAQSGKELLLQMTRICSRIRAGEMPDDLDSTYSAIWEPT